MIDYLPNYSSIINFINSQSLHSGILIASGDITSPARARAVLATPEIAGRFGVGTLGTTFGGAPLAAAAIVAVLVVDTKGFNGKSWFDRAGNHHSNQLRVTERFTLLDKDHMQYEATLEDPATYSAPWTIGMVLYRNVEPNAQLFEHKCVPFADKLLYSDLMGLDEENAE